MGMWTAGEIIETVLFSTVCTSGLAYMYRTGETDRKGAAVFGSIILYSVIALVLWHVKNNGLFLEYAVMHL